MLMLPEVIATASPFSGNAIGEIYGGISDCLRLEGFVVLEWVDVEAFDALIFGIFLVEVRRVFGLFYIRLVNIGLVIGLPNKIWKA